MAISIIQRTSANASISATPTTTVTATLGSTPSAANMIVAVVSSPAGGSGVWSFPAGWTTAYESYQSSAVMDMAVGYWQSDGSTTSFAFVASVQSLFGYGLEVWVAEVAGLGTGTLLDVSNAGGGTSGGNVKTSQAVSAGATNQASELWLGAIGLIEIAGHTVPSAATATGAWTPETIVARDDTSGATGLVIATDIVTSTGTPSTTLGWTTGINNFNWLVVTLKGAPATVPRRARVSSHPSTDIFRSRPLIERAPNVKPPLSEPGPIRVTVNKALIQQAKVTRTITPRAPALPPPKRIKVIVSRTLVQPAHVTRPRTFSTPPPLARPRITQNRAQVQTAHLVRPHVILTVTAPVAPPIPRATVTRNWFSQPSQRVLAGRTPRSPTGNRLVNLN